MKAPSTELTYDVLLIGICELHLSYAKNRQVLVQNLSVYTGSQEKPGDACDTVLPK